MVLQGIEQTTKKSYKNENRREKKKNVWKVGDTRSPTSRDETSIFPFDATLDEHNDGISSDDRPHARNYLQGYENSKLEE